MISSRQGIEPVKPGSEIGEEGIIYRGDQGRYAGSRRRGGASRGATERGGLRNRGGTGGSPRDGRGTSGGGGISDSGSTRKRERW